MAVFSIETMEEESDKVESDSLGFLFPLLDLFFSWDVLGDFTDSFEDEEVLPFLLPGLLSISEDTDCIQPDLTAVGTLDCEFTFIG